MNISIIILTFNEERHIRRCIESVQPLEADVFVVDSFSTDKTLEIARDLGARVYQNKWEGLYSRQFNWALTHLPIKSEWVLRLDADEYLCPDLVQEILTKLNALPADVTGVEFYLLHYFMGRVIRRGNPRIRMIRLFRFGKAQCEQRLMDEHMTLLEGRSVAFKGEFADHNLNDLSWWTQKHLGYAIREAADMLDLEFGLFEQETGDGERGSVGSGQLAVGSGGGGAVGSGQLAVGSGGGGGAVGSGQLAPAVADRLWRGMVGSGKGFNAETQRRRGGSVGSREGQGAVLGEQAAAKRRMKLKYAKAPLFWRALVYFCMRYFVRGGFLEGKEGFMWHFFQGLWYRMLVDAKIWEIKRESGGDREKILALLRGKYGLKV